MTTIDDLVSLVPPPASPVGAEGDWRAAQAALGLRLPSDFAALTARYGTGGFGDIGLLSPFPTDQGPGGLVARGLGLIEVFGEHREEWPEDVPHPLHPEPGGLLEWALTGNGDALCWLTEGEPDDWPTVVWNPRSGAARYEVGAVGLLHGYLSGRLDVPLLGAPPAVPWFDAHRELSHVHVRLSEGEGSHGDRLRILRDALHPTADRGGFDDGEGNRQDHFKAVDRDWRLTYENCYGHQVRVAFPPGDEVGARAVILAAVREMGCDVLSARTIEGEPVWSD
ncbi:SMI1/KNR4 family protein [Actinosynnema sp. NPDC047251]|uniref:Knr4/Smi1-like domain-containing protein n=1 Tax=Saccharothrix espanaensis (strain ATCC 51144 / DSM 44229 / JCM 9112 / NBRC 15066 / NRRL 15764) TaxID=1179773 RepID=K0JV79_SACES|nr:hypothetical protein [Saccharothrix espanaensis]CCH31770.1 hypothetical protein BN6_44900 [Saccharothrix espanaensis DSM 44229]